MHMLYLLKLLDETELGCSVFLKEYCILVQDVSIFRHLDTVLVGV